VHFYTKGGKLPFTVAMMKEVACRLDGSFATIIMNANNPYQVALMKDLRPVELLLIRPLKLVLVASETKFLDVMLFRYNKYLSLYNMNANMPQLRKEDVQSKFLANDDVMVMDLTKEITKDTDIKDLYEDGRIVYADKKWKAAYTTTTYYSSRNTPYTGRTNVKTGNKDKTKTATGAKTSAPVGKVWNKHTGGFKAPSTKTETTPSKSTVIDVKSGKTKSLSEVDNAEKKIVTAETKINVSGIDDKKKHDKPKDDVDKKGVVVVEEIDMTVNPKALEAAESRSAEIKYYEKEEEIVADLELASAEVLKNIPPVGLVNRVKKFIYKLGFYDGYCAKSEETGANGGDRPDLKGRKREKNIRVLKAMTKTLGSILDDACPEEDIRKRFEKLEKPKDLSPDNIKKLLRDGDIRDSKALRELIEWSSSGNVATHDNGTVEVKN